MMIPLWHRPEIVEMFIGNLRRTPCDYADVIPYFVLSPEDYDYHTLTDLTEGFNRTYVANTPLGHKKNEGLQRSLSLEWDYYMDMGSDDIYTDLLWDFLRPHLEANEEYFGILNTHSFNPYLNKAVFLRNYHVNWNDEVTAQGQGRCIRRDVVENCLPLWDDSAPFGMDGHSDLKITNKGYTCGLIDNGSQPVVCQVKSNICLTCWEQFDDMSEPADADWVREQFGLRQECCYNLKDFQDFHQAVLKVSNETENKEQAFNLMNEAHKLQTGEQRYSSYDSYKVTVSRKHKK